ncbi:hypothetical protein SAMN04488498_13044 [Mesorhizobium albiziae]|uniref:Uncharacterized protein n=1 Tax=Neomesorhizobium albiziae TaxID=335020 RepID=A0A1I4EX68_9HYPH|nr:hypothetical protein [Mesorhizobium albiziae]SFL09117.1 hypothetical protein SAMN04488498_13044 [Mesorhizobium albiziae]
MIDTRNSLLLTKVAEGNNDESRAPQRVLGSASTRLAIRWS